MTRNEEIHSDGKREPQKLKRVHEKVWASIPEISLENRK